MVAIIVERQRIGHAAARKDEALLTCEIGDVFDRPSAFGWGRRQKMRLEQFGGFARRDRSKAEAAGGGLDLDERLEPEQAARTGAHELDVEAAAARLFAIASATAFAPTDSAEEVLGNEDTRAHCVFPCGVRDDRVDAIAVETADRFAV